MSLLSPQFAAQLNTNFRTKFNDDKYTDLELIKVTDRTAPAGYECFSIFFRAPNDVPIAQKMFSLEHDQMDTMNIFLVPISQDQAGIVFEAVFNRLLD